MGQSADQSADQNIPLANRGLVVAVRGSVVDLRFDAQLPSIDRLLRAGSEGQIRIKVLAQLDAQHVRGIALTPTQALSGFQPESDAKPKPGGQRGSAATESGRSLNRQTQGPAESRENLRASC